ncbi:hypothetical protein [Morganella morganii IS15]|nr:hypothetical protein [Morganella morganii IS15]
MMRLSGLTSIFLLYIRNNNSAGLIIRNRAIKPQFDLYFPL